VLTFGWYFRGDVQLVLSNDYSGNLLLNNGKELIGTRAGSNLAEIALPLSLRSMSDALSVRFPIIGIWRGCLCVSIRMTGGIFVMQKLRKAALYSLPENLLKRFMVLSHLMNIRRKVMIYKSSEIKVPSVLGYLRPVILLPISVAAQIPVEQLEAIVAHELAHIRRHDYLVNLFQSVMEALFFYNPALLIKTQREMENAAHIATIFRQSDNYILVFAHS
jgi:beta-lactamase regulating signal transducer with metallopeptidase domain